MTTRELKHLNVTREEAVKVIVDFEVNKFAAYLVLTCGTPIVFAQEFEFVALQDRTEFVKYRDEWALPIEFSSLAATNC